MMWGLDFLGLPKYADVAIREFPAGWALGAFADGRHRYYLGDFGYQVSEKALRIQGHPVLQLRAGRKVYGNVNPAFRAGNFRE